MNELNYLELERPEPDESSYHPKEGWIEIVDGRCPICHGILDGPNDHDRVWTEQEPYLWFTGSYGKPVCCGKVWLTWRSSDKSWHHEIKEENYPTAPGPRPR